MKAITVIQPFAELIARGDKRIENRVWATSYRGPLAIHAGKSQSYNGDKVFDLAGRYGLERMAMSFGAIIAVAKLVDCVKLDDMGVAPRWASEKYPWMHGHEHTEGPFCFVLDAVTRLDKPIFVSGQRKLWDFNGL